MRAETWMNRMPRNPKTPIQLAEENVRHLEHRLALLSRQRDDVYEELRAAHEHLRKLLAK